MKSGKALSDTPGPVSESPKVAQGNGRFLLDADNFDGLTYCIYPVNVPLVLRSRVPFLGELGLPNRASLVG